MYNDEWKKLNEKRSIYAEKLRALAQELLVAKIKVGHCIDEVLESVKSASLDISKWSEEIAEKGIPNENCIS